MAVKDIKSNLLVLLAHFAAIGANGTTNGAVIDTADFELGLMFSVAIPAFTDGSYELVIEEDDDSGFGSPDIITDINKLIGDPITGLIAANAQGDPLPTIGVISNKRYVRASIVATGVTTGATLVVNCTQKGELKPVS